VFYPTVSVSSDLRYNVPLSKELITCEIPGKGSDMRPTRRPSAILRYVTLLTYRVKCFRSCVSTRQPPVNTHCFQFSFYFHSLSSTDRCFNCDNHWMMLAQSRCEVPPSEQFSTAYFLNVLTNDPCPLSAIKSVPVPDSEQSRISTTPLSNCRNNKRAFN